MYRVGITALFIVSLLLSCPWSATAQQFFRLPNKKDLKHITTKQSDLVRGPAGEKVTVDYYQASNGQVITIHSFHGRNVAFSVQSGSDAQNTYRVFVDMKGDGNFQETDRNWQIPVWAK